MRGSFSISRDIFDSWVFADASTLKIWIWLIGKARYKKGFAPLQIGKGNRVVELKRGQLIYGRSKAASALCLDGQFIYRKLKEFEKKGMINIKSDTQYSIITICNYDSYQPQKNDREQPMNSQRTTKEQPINSRQTAGEQAMNTNNNIINDNNVNKEYNKDNSATKVASSKKSIEERAIQFKKDIWQCVQEKRPQYNDKVLLKQFYEYWSERGAKARKMRKEKEKTFQIERRLDRWVSNQKNFNKSKDISDTQLNDYKDLSKSNYGF